MLFSFVRKFQMPFSTKEAGVSPGWTLEERKMVGLSNLYGLVSLSPFASGKSPSISSSFSDVMSRLEKEAKAEAAKIKEK